MSNVPADAARSEDGQWWWDGNGWQPINPDNWALLSVAADALARDRLNSIELKITAAGYAPLAAEGRFL